MRRLEFWRRMRREPVGVPCPERAPAMVLSMPAVMLRMLGPLLLMLGSAAGALLLAPPPQPALSVVFCRGLVVKGEGEGQA